MARGKLKPLSIDSSRPMLIGILIQPRIIIRSAQHINKCPISIIVYTSSCEVLIYLSQNPHYSALSTQRHHAMPYIVYAVGDRVGRSICCTVGWRSNRSNNVL